MTTVAEIPVHVAQKRIKALSLVLMLHLSPCLWHPGMSWAITELVVIPHKNIWGPLEKTHNNSVLYLFFSDRFCFCQGQVDLGIQGELSVSNQCTGVASLTWWEEAPRKATECVEQKGCDDSHSAMWKL